MFDGSTWGLLRIHDDGDGGGDGGGDDDGDVLAEGVSSHFVCTATHRRTDKSNEQTCRKLYMRYAQTITMQKFVICYIPASPSKIPGNMIYVHRWIEREMSESKREAGEKCSMKIFNERYRNYKPVEINPRTSYIYLKKKNDKNLLGNIVENLVGQSLMYYTCHWIVINVEFNCISI